MHVCVILVTVVFVIFGICCTNVNHSFIPVRYTVTGYPGHSSKRALQWTLNPRDCLYMKSFLQWYSINHDYLICIPWILHTVPPHSAIWTLSVQFPVPCCSKKTLSPRIKQQTGEDSELSRNVPIVCVWHSFQVFTFSFQNLFFSHLDVIWIIHHMVELAEARDVKWPWSHLKQITTNRFQSHYVLACFPFQKGICLWGK